MITDGDAGARWRGRGGAENSIRKVVYGERRIGRDGEKAGSRHESSKESSIDRKLQEDNGDGESLSE